MKLLSNKKRNELAIRLAVRIKRFLFIDIPLLTALVATILDRLGDASTNEVESDIGIKKAEELLSSNLCGSQLDLFMHGEGAFAPGHVKPRPESRSRQHNDNELNKMFLESEQNRISPKINSKGSSDESDVPTIETSSL